MPSVDTADASRLSWWRTVLEVLKVAVVNCLSLGLTSVYVCVCVATSALEALQMCTWYCLVQVSGDGWRGSDLALLQIQVQIS